MTFAKAVFTAAGIWGTLMLLPLYFAFDLIGRRYPPAVTHPDFYFGFVALAMAWQVGFLVIGQDPLRFHPLMGLGCLFAAAALRIRSEKAATARRIGVQYEAG